MIYLQDQPLDVTIFPDNTSQVWQIPEKIISLSSEVNVTWDFTHEGEFLHLAQLKRLLDHFGISAALTLKYLPYGRQDKVVSNQSTFALRVFADLLNSLRFYKVVINDPHSERALSLIENAVAKYPVAEVTHVVQLTQADLLCYPDAGAYTKYHDIYRLPSVCASKERDQVTGYITHYEIFPIDLSGRSILIVDDICDGGATFKLLAGQLTAAGASEVNLFVTHGLFSKGLKTLKNSGIKRVFTPDGEASEYQNNITYRRL